MSLTLMICLLSARMEDLQTMRDTINGTPAVDLEAPGMMELLMQQLLVDDGNPTCTQILPGLDLGRGAPLPL